MQGLPILMLRNLLVIDLLPVVIACIVDISLMLGVEGSRIGFQILIIFEFAGILLLDETSF